MRVTRIVTVIVACIVAAHTARDGQLRGRVIRHAAEQASSVIPLAITVIEPAFLAGLVLAAGTATRLLEASCCAIVRAVAAHTAAADAGQKVATAPLAEQAPEISHARSPSEAQKTCETSARRARAASSRALRST